MDITLTGKKILITGGTSTLGAEFVKRAAEERADIFFTYHTNEQKARELSKLGATSFRLDLADNAAIKAFASEFKKTVSVLDGLIHNAAAVSDRTIQNMEESEWDRILQIDLKAVFLLSKELLRPLMKKPWSKVLIITSRVGLSGGFGQANYAAAKGGLIAFAKSFAQEMGRKKILVNTLTPGFMRSQMTETMPAEVFEANVSKSVVGEMADPAEVADFMVYLMSERARHVSGQTFHFETRRP